MYHYQNRILKYLLLTIDITINKTKKKKKNLDYRINITN